MTIRPARDHRRDRRHPIVITLKGRRLALGLTQREVAAAIGVSQGTLAGWEVGRVAPTLGSIAAWATALGCELVVVEGAGS